MKDNIIAIITYCDTQEKKDVLVRNIGLIKNKYSDFDIAIHANYPLPEYIQQMSDIYIYEDLNVIVDKFFSVWRVLPFFNKKFIYNVSKDYGYSVFLQIKNLAKYLIEYKKILLINYDLVIEDIYIENHFIQKDLIIYGEEPACYLLVMSFIPSKLKNIFELFNLEEYITNTNTAENIFYDYMKKYNVDFIQINYSVKDTISNMPYLAFKNEFFVENLISFNNNKLEIYLWFLYQNINSVKLKINNDELEIENINNNGGFESMIYYYEEILDIKIISINNIDTNIPLNIIKNTIIENL